MKAAKSELDIMLILPPQWTPLSPYYALPVLAGEIRKEGYTCRVRDLNIEFYHHILSPEYLTWCRQGAEAREGELGLKFIEKLADTGAAPEDDLYFELQERIRRAELNWDFVVDNIESAKVVLMNKHRFYQPKELQWSFEVLCKALDIASLPYFPSQILLRDFRNRHHQLTMASIIEAVNNVQENPFLAYYQQVLPSIQEENPRVIGISINASSQIIAGLTLAKLLKDNMPETHVSIGGNFFTRVVNTLETKPEFFLHFGQSLAYEEGERPLVSLIQQVKTNGSLSEVPNLLFLEDGVVKKTPPGCPKPLNEIALPALEDLDLEKYLSPEIVIPIQASRGCYWKKCSFCDHDFGVNYNLKSFQKLVDEIRLLRECYGIRHFEFIDEAISPAYLRRMSQMFIDEELDIRFFMYARTEVGFSKELLDLAYQAGCRMIMWGLESGSERIMKLIEKGVPLETRFKPLENATAAGIWNFAFLFFGFPTETIEEAMETIHMVVDHKDIIHSYGMSHFTLGKHTRLKESPAKYGIVNIREDVEELSTRLHYECTEGMNHDELMKVTELCTEICNEVYHSPLWFSIGFREFLHLYLDKFGLDHIKNVSLRPEHKMAG